MQIISFGKHSKTKDNLQWQCKGCYAVYKKTHRKEINIKNVEWSHRVGRRRPYQSLKDQSLYLGVCVAENLLSMVFKNVIKMPMRNIGYDFICGKGFKVDVKSSCLRKRQKCWWFGIHKNKIADYFACIAFDNRKSITPLHFWLFPGEVINQKTSITISNGTLYKWKSYEKPLDKLSAICEIQKQQKGIGIIV